MCGMVGKSPLAFRGSLQPIQHRIKRLGQPFEFLKRCIEICPSAGADSEMPSAVRLNASTGCSTFLANHPLPNQEVARTATDPSMSSPWTAMGSAEKRQRLFGLQRVSHFILLPDRHKHLPHRGS